MFPTVEDVYRQLGFTEDDVASDIVQTFLDRRIQQIKEITSLSFEDSVPMDIFYWVLYYTCSDVLFRHTIGFDLGSPLKYKIGELSEDFDDNVKVKLEKVNQFIDEAEKALTRWAERRKVFAEYTEDVYGNEVVIGRLFTSSEP